MIRQLRELIACKDLVSAWTGRTIRARYQQTLLGWLWVVIQPVATVAVFSLVFTRVVKIETQGIPYPAFSFVALIPWIFFSTSLNDMANSLVQNPSLLTKIYFPRESLVLAATLARLLDFAVSAVLMVVVLVVFEVRFEPVCWLFLPAILVVQLMLMLGLGLMASALNVFYRDVQPVLTICLQLWFYISPILYPVSLVPETIRPLFLLNPMSGIVESYRDVLLRGTPPGAYLAISGLTAATVLTTGYWFFKRVEFQFADVV